jgi:glucosamine--fructose-6-phosphate aminotransferase (isomerizing)
MENPLWADIQAQGENLRHVVDHLYGAERQRLQAAAHFLDNGKPIVFTGMASAAYTNMPAEFYLGQHGRYASTIGASDALYSLLPALHGANVVINSRSGETAEIVKLGQALVEAGVPFLALTNEPESTLAHQATHILWSNTRKDDLVSINVVTGMTVACLALCAELLGEMETLRPDLDKLTTAMDDAVVQAVKRADEITDFFAGIRPIYLLYRGARRAAALCGRLVLEEVSRRPAVPLEAGEFRQGPNEVIDEHFGALLFAASGEMAPLDLRLAQDIRASGGRVLVVGSAEVCGRLAGSGIPSFEVSAIPSYLSPIVELAPVQLLAYKSAERQGYSPGTVRYITKVITSEAGIPNQVQR